MSSSTSHKSSGHKRGAHGGHGGGGGSHGGGGGGGGGGEGPLVKVAFARNQAEAEMLQGLLLESDIPSVLKRSRGFDNPDFLAGGPHDVFVAQTMARKAREVLADTVVEDEAEERAELDDQARLERDGTDTSARRLALWLIAALVGAVILVWLAYQLS
ncbi:MAG: hypothetical protein ABW065_01860 [Solirubrobacterales bacterium]